VANDLNQCFFIGRLGRDPEVRYLPTGDAVVNISIAVGKSWKDKNTQEKKESTTWVPVSYFGKTAEIIGQYARKGRQCQVTGEFSVRKYNDKDGIEKTITEIKGDRFQLLGSDDSQQGAPAQRQAAPAQRQAASAQRGTAVDPARKGFGDMDDDIPF